MILQYMWHHLKFFIFRLTTRWFVCNLKVEMYSDWRERGDRPTAGVLLTAQTTACRATMCATFVERLLKRNATCGVIRQPNIKCKRNISVKSVAKSSAIKDR